MLRALWRDLNFLILNFFFLPILFSTEFTLKWFFLWSIGRWHILRALGRDFNLWIVIFFFLFTFMIIKFTLKWIVRWSIGRRYILRALGRNLNFLIIIFFIMFWQTLIFFNIVFALSWFVRYSIRKWYAFWALWRNFNFFFIGLYLKLGLNDFLLVYLSNVLGFLEYIKYLLFSPIFNFLLLRNFRLLVLFIVINIFIFEIPHTFSIFLAFDWFLITHKTAHLFWFLFGICNENHFSLYFLHNIFI